MRTVVIWSLALALGGSVLGAGIRWAAAGDRLAREAASTRLDRAQRAVERLHARDGLLDPLSLRAEFPSAEHGTDVSFVELGGDDERLVVAADERVPDTVILAGYGRARNAVRGECRAVAVGSSGSIARSSVTDASEPVDCASAADKVARIQARRLADGVADGGDPVELLERLGARGTGHVTSTPPAGASTARRWRAIAWVSEARILDLEGIQDRRWYGLVDDDGRRFEECAEPTTDSPCE